jgi:hypothetical protein
MGIDNLINEVPLTTIKSSQWNKIVNSLSAELVPRDIFGIVGNIAGSLGSTLYRWKSLFLGDLKSFEMRSNGNALEVYTENILKEIIVLDGGSINTALATLPVIGGKITVMGGVTENVVWPNDNIVLCGTGRGSIITGDFTLSGIGNVIENISFEGNVILGPTSRCNAVGMFYLSATSSFENQGSTNLFTGVQL